MPGFKAITLEMLCAVTLLLLHGNCPAQPAPIPFHVEAYELDSGFHTGLPEESHLAFSATVAVPGATWLRLQFGEHDLGERSYLTLTALEDGGRQRLDARSLAEWRNASAYFNGDAVAIEMTVAAGDHGIFVQVVEVEVGEPGPVPESLCGSDDRVPWSDPGIGRIVPVGCTGWIAVNGAILTAGHCTDGSGTYMSVLEFNVPPSLGDGTIVHPDPIDQYAIDANRIAFQNNGTGDDYAVFACFPNSVSGLTVTRAQGAFHRLSGASAPPYVRVSGYGLDSTPPGTSGGYNADSQTQQTNLGLFLGEHVQGPSRVSIEYLVDTEGGNSGSPVTDDQTSVSIGIHTTGGCSPPSSGNSGTGFENDGLEAMVSTFPGPAVTYVDAAHPSGPGPGTILRPYAYADAGIDSTHNGGIVSFAPGMYSCGHRIFNGRKSLTAPVGTVVIGPGSLSGGAFRGRATGETWIRWERSDQ